MPARIHAAASVSSVHLLVAIEGGELYRYNTETQVSELLLDLMSDVTSLSFDAFSGIVCAGLQSLEVLSNNPYTGELTAFDTMPSIGRVTVSPDGRLWFVPAKHVQQNSISFWDLPNELESSRAQAQASSTRARAQGSSMRARSVLEARRAARWTTSCARCTSPA